jgi:hypothetical protein
MKINPSKIPKYNPFPLFNKVAFVFGLLSLSMFVSIKHAAQNSSMNQNQGHKDSVNLTKYVFFYFFILFRKLFLQNILM